MMEFERFKLYWVATRRLAVALIIFSFAVMAGSLFFSARLDAFHLLGFPVGVLVMGQGVVIFAIAVMFWFVGSQQTVDTSYGANEDI